MTQLQYEQLELCRLIVKLDLGLASCWLFPSINFQFRTESFLSIFLGWQEWPARFWEVQAVGNVVKISIQQRWESENEHPRKPLQNHPYADLWAKWPKEMVSGRHIKDNKNGKQVNFSFSKIWWASKVSLLAIRNDCVARSYRFSVPLTCTRAIIRQKVYSLAVHPGVVRAFALRFCEAVAQLNFPFELRSTLSLYSRGSVGSTSSLPDRPFNQQMTPSRNFVLLWACVRFKKCRLWMVTNAPAGFPPGGSLPFCFCRSSRCLAGTCSFASDVLHVSRRLCAVCASLSTSSLGLQVTHGLALLVVRHPNFFLE